jgi:hypothetical protein
MVKARISGQPAVLRDGDYLVQQGLRTMVKVARGSNLKIAMEAAEWLVSYGEQILAEKRRLVPEERAKRLSQTREGLIQELRGLYAKALGEPLVVEATVEPADPGGRT